jgi:hypothetical protein
MKFYNPQLDIKVIRRPWQGKSKNVEAPCEANIIRGYSFAGVWLICSGWNDPED